MTDHWNSDAYAKNARFVTSLGASVLELLAPQPGEDVLDLGCGDGVLAEQIAATGAQVIGVDSSEAMVASARKLGVDARVVFGESLPFNAEFDAVFSNAALHWMTDPDAVIAGVFNALRPGGRFVAEMGGHGNVAAIRTALMAAMAGKGHRFDLKDVWYFPSPEGQSTRLEKAGFTVEAMDLIPRPTPVASGMAAWLGSLAGPVLAKVPENERAGIVEEAVELLRPALQTAEGLWIADYQRLRFKALKP